VWEKTANAVQMGSDWFLVPVFLVSAAGVAEFNHNSALLVLVQHMGPEGPPGPQGPPGPTQDISGKANLAGGNVFTGDQAFDSGFTHAGAAAAVTLDATALAAWRLALGVDAAVRVASTLSSPKEYASHAAADRDTTLQSKSFYKLRNSRNVYQKP
jgi:hypothetical protein